MRYFPILPVFDQSQTDPIDPKAEDPSHVAQQLHGEDPAGILESATDYPIGQGWIVTRELIAVAASGYTTTDGTRRVVSDARLAPQAARTGLHEAAHVILHAEDHPDYVEYRGIKETEAESVAYVVAEILGLTPAATPSATSPDGAAEKPKPSATPPLAY